MTDRPTRDHYTITEHNGATLRREGDHYVMRGSGSEHRLLVSATGINRLAVHWRGFSGWRGETWEITGPARAARKANRAAVEALHALRETHEGVVRAIREREASMSDAELFEARTAGGRYRGARRFVRGSGGDLRAAIGRIVTVWPRDGWSNFVVVGISRDGERFRVRRLRTGDGCLNKTITLLNPSETDI